MHMVAHRNPFFALIDTEKSIACKECGQRIANSNNVLARHLRTAHGIEWMNYVVKHDHAGIWPMCACECGTRLEWKKGGFGKYASGHGPGPVGPVQQIEQLGDGWVLNPFTGCEERIVDSDCIEFLKHCVSVGDPITADHGVRVGWEDSRGKLKISAPSFKHIKLKLIFLVSHDNPELQREIVGYRAWCAENSFSMFVVRRESESFNVIDAYIHER